MCQSNQLSQELMAKLQSERNKLAILLIKQKTMAKVQLHANLSNFGKQLGKITESSNDIKRKEINHALLSEQKILLLTQQKSALKKQLAKLDAEFNNLKVKLDKEVNFFSRLTMF